MGGEIAVLQRIGDVELHHFDHVAIQAIAAEESRQIRHGNKTELFGAFEKSRRRRQNVDFRINRPQLFLNRLDRVRQHGAHGNIIVAIGVGDTRATVLFIKIISQTRNHPLVALAQKTAQQIGRGNPQQAVAVIEPAGNFHRRIGAFRLRPPQLEIVGGAVMDLQFALQRVTAGAVAHR